MSVNIVDHTAEVKITMARNTSLGVRFMLDGIDKEAFSNTPLKDNHLRKDILKSVVGTQGKIKWAVNYASVQEAGGTRKKVFRKYTTAGTGPHFAENAVKKVTTDAGTYWKKANVI